MLDRLFDGAGPRSALEDRSLLEPLRKSDTLKLTGTYIDRGTLSPDGSLIAAVDTEEAYYEERIYLWDAKNGRRLRRLKGCWNPDSLSFSSDGTKLLGACRDQRIVVWDVRSGKRLRTIHGVDDLHYGGSAWLTPDDSRIILHSAMDTAYSWNALAREKGPALLLEVDRRKTTHMALSRDGSRALTAHNGGFVYLHDLKSDKRKFLFRRQRVYSLLLSDGGETALVASSKGEITLFNGATGEPIRALRVSAHAAWPALNRDGSKLAAHCDNRLVVYDTRTGEILFNRQTEESNSPIAFGADDTLLLTSTTGELRLRKIDWTPEELQALASRVKEGAVAAQPAGPEDGESAEERFKLP